MGLQTLKEKSFDLQPLNIPNTSIVNESNNEQTFNYTISKENTKNYATNYF